MVPSALELLDQHCLAAVDEWKNMGLSADAEAILLARVDAPGAAGEAEADAVLAAFEAAGATWAARSSDPEEADALFSARRLAYPALERLGPGAHRGRLRPGRRGAGHARSGSRRSAGGTTC